MDLCLDRLCLISTPGRVLRWRPQPFAQLLGAASYVISDLIYKREGAGESGGTIIDGIGGGGGVEGASERSASTMHLSSLSLSASIVSPSSASRSYALVSSSWREATAADTYIAHN